MDKTYATHGRVAIEYQRNRSKSVYKFLKAMLTRSTVPGKQFPAHEPFDNLKANLLSRCSGTKVKSILFNGICHGTGCSITALNFANSLTVDSMCKVLLVDLNSNGSHFHGVYPHAETENPSGLITDGKHLMFQIRKVGPENLYNVSCGAESLFGPVGLFKSSPFERFIRSIYDTFDYLILDVPPIVIHSEFRILCSCMDAVVLVLESENARRQVALRAKKEIEEAGGQILGVVINRRKYYIPEWIYKRL